LLMSALLLLTCAVLSAEDAATPAAATAAASATATPAPASNATTAPLPEAKANADGNPKEVDSVSADGMRPRRAIVLSMQEAVRLTLENSMKVKINRVDPQVALAAIEKAEAKFDWSFVSTVSANRDEVPSGTSSALTKSSSESQTVKAGLKKSLLSGGTIQPTLQWQRNSSDTSSGQGLNAYVSITQPLLRDAGTEVNSSDIKLARNNADIARYQFKDSVLTTLSTMQQTYWDLVFAIEDLDVKRKSLRLTRDTLDQTRAQVEAGLLAPIEIARVRADLASKEVDILDAQRVLEEKEDQIRQFINKPTSRLLDDVGVIPLERAAYVAVYPDLEAEALTALESRPDYQVFYMNVKNRDIELVVAKNQKLPVVDLAATVGLNGLGNDFEEAARTMGKLDFTDWSASVSVEVPLGNRAAKAGYLTARLNRVKALLQLKNAQDDIIISIKSAVRLVLTNYKRIHSTRVARELAEERLRAEEEKFNVGTALILDVLNAQTLLAQAESAERGAIVDYNKALIALERTKGTLLERDNIFLNTELGPTYKAPSR